MSVFDINTSFEQALQMHTGGRLLDAEQAYRAILRRLPDHVPSLANLGTVLMRLGLLKESVEYQRRALLLDPKMGPAYNNLGNALRELGQMDESIDAFSQAMEIRPDDPDAHMNLANAYMAVGRLDDMIAVCRRSIELAPQSAAYASNLAFMVHFHGDYDAAAILRECSDWDRRFAQPYTAAIRGHRNDQDPERKLRVGYIGSNFWDHCVSLFSYPLLRHHDRRKFESHVYANQTSTDWVTEKFQQLDIKFKPVAALNDDELADRVRRDGIDILVDLTMHMAGNRLGVFARKPAPVQATWIAYPGTTGMRAMGYRLTDPQLDPPDGTAQSDYSETTVRLPDTFWCYDPLTAEPDVGLLPMEANGHVTFGCLNNFCKVTPRSLRLWAAVMRRVDGSRLIVLSPQGRHRAALLILMGEEGISSDRIEFADKRPRVEYLRLYNRIDVCLDTLPYNGHTTSLDAFWMGAPVVTQVGSTVVGRAGLSQLTNLGLVELVAWSDEQFVDVASQLAQDRAKLAGIRAGLRARMERSALMDGERFARGMEAAYRSMWRTWCGR